MKLVSINMCLMGYMKMDDYRKFVHVEQNCLEKSKSELKITQFLVQSNNRDTMRRCEICLELTIKTPNDVDDVVLEFLLLTLNIFLTCF